MEEDNFFVQKVSSLSSSYSTDCTQEGRVYICKTKAGNRALWQHYFTQVLNPIIVTSRKAHQRGNAVSVDGSPLPFNLKARSMLCSDGEAIIMNSVFTPYVLAAFKAAEVDYLKLGPSCTKVQQAWDAGTLFRDAKCGLQYVVAQQYKLLDERFREAIFGSKEEGCAGFFATMFEQFPNPTIKAFWSAKQQERLVYSLELIKKVLERSHSSHKMKASFETTGHFPLNVQKMIMKCSRPEDIIEAELELKMKELPAAAEEGMRTGMCVLVPFYLFHIYID